MDATVQHRVYNDIVYGRQRRIERPLHVYSDPLDRPDDGLYERYRFRRESILFLLQTLSIQARPTNRSNPVPPLYAILLALRFYATGSFYNIVGDTLLLSKATVCRCVKRVTEALCQQVAAFVNYRTTEAERKRAFFDIAGKH